MSQVSLTDFLIITKKTSSCHCTVADAAAPHGSLSMILSWLSDLPKTQSAPVYYLSVFQLLWYYKAVKYFLL